MIRLPNWLGTSMLDHADECAPFEACGLVSRDGDGQWSGFFPVPNAVRSRSRFVMTPEGLYSAIGQVESGGAEVAGFFHSHPNGLREPSEVDLAEWPDQAWVSFIGFPFRGSGQLGWMLRAFELANDGVVAVPLHGSSVAETRPTSTLRS